MTMMSMGMSIRLSGLSRCLVRSYATLPKRESTLEMFKFPRATADVSNLNAGERVVLNGWVDKKTKKMSKGLVFGRLRDTEGQIVQLVDRNNPSLIKSLQPESAIAVTGMVENNQDKYDLVVDNVQVLNQSNIIGSQLTTGSTKEWPPEHRYLQLRTDQSLLKNIKTRAKVVKACREALDGMSFTEIETPLLFKSTPEGAREFLVPTRKKGMMYALPQSPQQYKQLLMASGVHKYYQIAKCFRDEDLRQDRQYEFTQLDMEMSFANGNDVRAVIEQVIRDVWSKVGYKLYNPDGLPAGKEFVSLTYREAIAKYGIDKPDLRWDHEIVNVSEYATATNPEFPVVEAMRVSADSFSSRLESPTSYNQRLPVIVKSEDDWSLATKVANIHDLGGFKCKIGYRPGDVIAIATRQELSYENPTPLGRFRQLVIEEFPDKNRVIDDPNGFVATWVVDFPLFNPLELDAKEDSEYPVYDYNSYVTTHHPFTMANPDDYDNLETSPLSVRGQHYDLVINGVEVGGGSTRIHNVELQKYIFDNILRIQNSEKLFGHLLRAFATGCPPHAGLAIGLDRMVAMLCGTQSIRDVIAFPKTITGADPMIGCPSKVTKPQLEPYHIRL